MGKGEKIVITGATGMVGAHLVAELINNGAERVTIAVRNAGRVTKLYEYLDALEVTEYIDKIDVQQVDLLNPHDLNALLNDCGKLFHCAAEVSFSDKKAQHIIETNTRITALLVNAALEQNIGMMVHVSSIAAIGSADYPGITDESHRIKTLANESAYSISKFYAENEVWRGVKMGLNAVIVNPSVILGIGDWNGHGSASLFKSAAQGMPFYTTGTMGYIDVRDVVKAMRLLSDKPETWGKRYLISAHNLSYREFFNAVADSVGKRHPVFRAGKTIMTIAWFADNMISKITGKEPLVAHSIIKTSQNKILYYSDLIYNATGMEYRSLDDTIEFIAKQYKNR